MTMEVAGFLSSVCIYLPRRQCGGVPYPCPCLAGGVRTAKTRNAPPTVPHDGATAAAVRTECARLAEHDEAVCPGGQESAGCGGRAGAHPPANATMGVGPLLRPTAEAGYPRPSTGKTHMFMHARRHFLGARLFCCFTTCLLEPPHFLPSHTCASIYARATGTAVTATYAGPCFQRCSADERSDVI